MKLAEELRETADEVIRHRIEVANLQILNKMIELAMDGLYSVCYPRTELSDEFIHYLVEKGFGLYGRHDENSAWINFYPVENTIPKFNEIMIKW